LIVAWGEPSLSSLSPQAAGRGTARSAVEGQSGAASPSTSLRLVPLPIRFADREDRWALPELAACERPGLGRKAKCGHLRVQAPIQRAAFMKSLGLAFLAGLVSALGFAPLGLWPLMLLGFAVLAWLLEGAPSLRSALARGWWFGLGQFVLGLNWIATAFTYQAAMPAWLGWVAVVLLSLYLAIYPAMAAGLAWRWGWAGAGTRKGEAPAQPAEGRRLRLVLLLAAAWIVAEWLRASLFTGFAWNPVGVVLIAPCAAWLAPWLGTYGLSGIVVLLGGALRLVLAGRFEKKAAAALVLAIVAASAAAWASRPASAPPGAAVRIVQPNIGQQNKWDRNYERRNFERFVQLTGTPAAVPRLLLWPEASTPAYLAYEPDARQRLAALLGPRNLLLLGGVEPLFDAEGRGIAAYNSVYVLTPDGRLTARYDKSHLVPYGEYLPMRPVLSAIGLSRLAPGDLDFRDGPGPRTLDLGAFGRAGVQVCYEIIFSGQVVDEANRPDFLFNPSNDAWFGAWGPPQHLAQARLRAIEEGMPIIRATPTGISAVIDADGMLEQSLPLGSAGVIDAHVPGAAPPTLFARFGNALPFIFALLLVAAAIAVRRKAR
jgi:apolipoprotein N-acyltransferase